MQEDHTVLFSVTVRQSKEPMVNQTHLETSFFTEHSNDKGYLAPMHTAKTKTIKNKRMKTSADNV